MIVRGYITGVTSTSLWTLYAQGERKPYGIALPDGLHKNDALPTPIITPTTKADRRRARRAPDARRDHRARAGRQAAVGAGRAGGAGDLRARAGSRAQSRAGAGRYQVRIRPGRMGKLMLIDEVHTPDSSRYWTLEVAAKLAASRRTSTRKFCASGSSRRAIAVTATIPAMPPEVIARVAERYISAYERLTGQTLRPRRAARRRAHRAQSWRSIARE